MKTLLNLLGKKSLWLTGIILLLLSSSISPAMAEPVLASYQARLSWADHYNTEGVRLWTIGGIVRQDRAHFHYYGIQDQQDEWDPLYNSVNNRINLETMLSNQRFSPYEREVIVNGNPLIQVTVYPHYVLLTIVE